MLQDGAVDAAGQGPEGNPTGGPLGDRGPDSGFKLRGVSWNVAGVATREWDNFFRSISRSVQWHILFLQEFSGYNGQLRRYSSDGHWILAADPKPGQRRMAIVVHKDVIQYVVENSFVHEGRVVWVDLDLPDMYVRCICAHLFPSGDMAPYRESVDNLDKAISGIPSGGGVVIGVDVQDSLGIFDSDDQLYGEYVGKCVTKASGAKGQTFMDFMVEHDLWATNTFAEGVAPWTCHYFCKAEP